MAIVMDLSLETVNLYQLVQSFLHSSMCVSARVWWVEGDDVKLVFVLTKRRKRAKWNQERTRRTVISLKGVNILWREMRCWVFSREFLVVPTKIKTTKQNTELNLLFMYKAIKMAWTPKRKEHICVFIWVTVQTYFRCISFSCLYMKTQ